MRRISTALVTLACVLGSLVTALGQSVPAGPSVTVPRLIHITGAFQPVDGQPPAALEVATVSIYAEVDGGLPVWQERQSVAVDKTTGRFTLLLGASYPDGIPAEVFGAGQAHWMSLLFERLGEVEQPRVRIASVPYALKASDAETLGGLPASAYVRAPTGDPASVGVAKGDTSLGVTSMEAPVAEAEVLPGTMNYLAKYVNAADVGNSAVYESNGRVGIGTTTPFDTLYLRFNDPTGVTTGLAVQNLGNTPTSYSGMLFYDQFGGLGQFQGFNNVTHEYRINNIANNNVGVPDGSINFMLRSQSRFFVASNGNIGIGTTSPLTNLEVSNATNALAGPTGNIFATTFSNYGAGNPGSQFVGRRVRGNPAGPGAVLNSDVLAVFAGQGYHGTGFSEPSGMTIRAAEPWLVTQQGTRLQFLTTAIGTTVAVNRMTLGPSGYLGLGTDLPDAVVDIVRQDDTADFRATGYSAGGGNARFLARTARGTIAAPTAIELGDDLGEIGFTGRGTTDFGQFAAGMSAFAAQNWTDTAHGAGLFLAATPLGSTTVEGNLVILPGGNVGIGAFTNIPTIPDKLQVFGDIRVGTTGTNGCLKNFAGTQIAGTCVSDRRFKRNISPFGSMLGALTALQPVHYNWRVAEFPERQFGESRTYGLIAQDVEQVLPELVVTNDDGFKAVDYSKLPLLTIQAVKELKAENDALHAANDHLKAETAEMKAETNALQQRLAELEHRFAEMLAH